MSWTALEQVLGATVSLLLGDEVRGLVREPDGALVGGLVSPQAGAEVMDYSNNSTVGCSENW
jgi:hypothetical protein